MLTKLCGGPVCGFLLLVLQLEMAKEPELALFRKLDGLQRADVKELRDGTHIFAVYGTLSSG